MAAMAALFLAACGDADSPGARGAESEPPIARVHRSRCGGCHERHEPGEFTPEVFRAALTRHHDRLRLTETQWAEMLDYLSAPASPKSGGS